MLCAQASGLSRNLPRREGSKSGGVKDSELTDVTAGVGAGVLGTGGEGCPDCGGGGDSSCWLGEAEEVREVVELGGCLRVLFLLLDSSGGLVDEIPDVRDHWFRPSCPRELDFGMDNSWDS